MLYLNVPRSGSRNDQYVSRGFEIRVSKESAHRQYFYLITCHAMRVYGFRSLRDSQSIVVQRPCVCPTTLACLITVSAQCPRTLTPVLVVRTTRR